MKPPSVAEQIDAIYKQFKKSWEAGQPPRLKEMLKEVPAGQREALLQELLYLDVKYRRRRGEQPTAEDYLPDFPDQQALICSLLAGVPVDPPPANRHDTTPVRDAPPPTATPDRPAPPTPSDRRSELSFLEPPQAEGELGRLGRFRILEVLGIGGMGIVFRAADTELPRDIALKVMRPEYSSQAEARQRFLHEARAMATVKDDHVITIYDVDTLGPVAFVAMELLRGQGLHHRLERRHRLDWPEVVQIGIEAARGLAAAHASGLIHRDVKPSNLWLEELRGAGPNERRERVKVLDFGLARQIDCDRSFSPEGTVMGTPAYMAPEQARGERVDERADLFSLGCVLYELVTSRRPFDGREPLQILLQVIEHQPPPALHLIPELPGSLSRLIEGLLAKDRDARPASARDVVARLQAVAGERTGSWSGVTPPVQPNPEQPVTDIPHRDPSTATSPPAAPPTDTDVTNRPPGPVRVRRRVVVAVLASALALGLVAGGWVAWHGLWKSPPVEQPLRGELIVRVWSKDRSKRGGQIGIDDLAVPVREDEQLHLEAKLNQPVYIYLLWIDGKGAVTGLYPWGDEGRDCEDVQVPPPPQKPQATVHTPSQLNKGWPVDETVGLDTMLLLARKTPLPTDVRLADLFDKVPPAPLVRNDEVVVRGLNDGTAADEVSLDLNRRPKGQAELIDNQLLLLMNRLKEHFELIRAVQFAHARK